MQKSLNFISPINRLGYGQTGYYLTRELSKLYDLHLSIIGQPEYNDQFLQQAGRKPHFKQADCVRLWHQHDLKMFIGKGRHVGFPIFELDTFTDNERHQLQQLDRLFVCSEWAKSVIEQNGITTPVDVIPLGVDGDIFNPSKVGASRPGKTIFFNCGKWEVRKGHPELAVAFARAFKPSDAVELWLMCDNPFYPADLVNSFKSKFTNSPMGGNIKFINRVEHHSQVAKIMSSATVGVFPAKAEGWNLELLEMLALGKHVITTNYSGHTEFCNAENAHLIEPTGMETAVDNIWFKGQGNWCTFEINDVAEQMAALHELNMSGKLGINEKGIEAGRKFTWENAARKIQSVLC
jgi:glycosyltransferase involved in cell wall biosynthesis